LTLPAGSADLLQIPTEAVPGGYKQINVTLQLYTRQGTQHLYPRDTPATVFAINLTNVHFPTVLAPDSMTPGSETGYPQDGRRLEGSIGFLTTFLVDPAAHDLAIVSSAEARSTLVFGYC